MSVSYTEAITFFLCNKVFLSAVSIKKKIRNHTGRFMTSLPLYAIKHIAYKYLCLLLF